MRSTSLVLAALVAPAAAHVDWRDTGCVGDVSNQGHLGTTDVAPTVEAVQCALYNATGQVLKLSTEQVLDCATNLGEFGAAFAYIFKNGLESAAAYPSESTRQARDDNVGRPKCIYEESLVVARVGDVGGSAVGDANETDLQTAAHFSPVAVAFTVGTELELYTGGVITDCGVGGVHIMEVVGFSDHDPDTNDTAYWIVKNSWGKDWGIDGYVHIGKDVGACGLDKPTYLYPKNVTVVESSVKKQLRKGNWMY